jgi:predicted flap endonuclease-1-like 5' DNA nuclease
MRRGLSIWITAAITFLAFLNAIYALILITQNGSQTEVIFPITAGNTFAIPVSIYFWASMFAAFTFLGVISIVSNRKLPPNPATLKLFDTIDAKLQHNRQTLEGSINETFGKFAMQNFEITSRFNRVLTQLKQTQQEIENFKKMREETGKITKNQMENLTKIKKKLEAVERQIDSQMMPEPFLNSQSDVEKIEGVGEKTGEELKAAGITTVCELLTEDSPTIAEKTKMSKKTIEKIQITAHLLMIPGLKRDDAILLRKAGISSINDFAHENPIHLCKKVAEVAENNQEKLRIEEVASWIRFARSYFYPL